MKKDLDIAELSNDYRMSEADTEDLYSRTSFEPEESSLFANENRKPANPRGRSPRGSSNLATSYLQEMKRYGLLSHEEEQELGRCIKEGHEEIVSLILGSKSKAKEMVRLRTMVSEWEERVKPPKPKEKLLKMIQTGLKKASQKNPKNREIARLVRRIRKVERVVEKAKKRMTNANLRLVITIAKAYLGKGLSFSDLIQEGNIGLMKAVNRFDYSRGYKFSTYATWWIRQSINRAIYDKARTIRIPIHIREERKKLFKVYNDFIKETGQEPETWEIAKRMCLPVERVERLLSASRELVSLSAPVGEEGSTLGDFIEGKNVASPLDVTTDSQLIAKTQGILSVLTPREEKIIRLRYGIGGEAEHTLEEIGHQFNVSRERIRQIEKRALERLRHFLVKSKLKNFLEE